jgi:hypothetical protein
MYSRTIIGISSIVAFCCAPLAWAESEQREVDEFEEVSFALPFDVEFVASDEFYVKLVGDEDTIDEIITEVKGDTLKIHKESKWFDWSDEEVQVTVGYNKLSAISMAGSGDGFAEEIEADDMNLRIAGSASLEINKLVCNDLKISIAGSGNVNLNELEADSMSTKIAGSGDVDVAGEVVSQEVSINGSGDHNARELRSQEADVSIHGSGDVGVWTVASLNASVMGSGDIEYYGDPKLEERIRGSGNIERLGDEP